MASGPDPYVDKTTGVLFNRLGASDTQTLDYLEREWVVQRITEGCPSGDFDLTHLRAIHRHLFQDVFDWAGELRSVEISKNGDQFQFRAYIETGMADVHARLRVQNFLRGMTTGLFAEGAAKIIGDVNYIHPFREGNGRAQLQYLQQLAEAAGHPLDITLLAGGQWVAASRASHNGDYALMSREILHACGG